MECTSCVSSAYYIYKEAGIREIRTEGGNITTEGKPGYSECRMCAKAQNGCSKCYYNKYAKTGITCKGCIATHFIQGSNNNFECKSCELVTKNCVRCSNQ